MDAFLNETETKKTNYKGYILGAIIGLIAIAAIIFIAARRPSMEDQAAAVLEGASREGSPDFDAITKDIATILKYGDESVSVALEEVTAAEWAEKVYRPDIVEKAATLYKKPGYEL